MEGVNGDDHGCTTALREALSVRNYQTNHGGTSVAFGMVLCQTSGTASNVACSNPSLCARDTAGPLDKRVW